MGKFVEVFCFFFFVFIFYVVERKVDIVFGKKICFFFVKKKKK